MTKKAFLALCVVVLLPVLSYLAVKGFSERARLMPPRYYADSVIEKVVDGKMISDTAWHRIENITLTNQLGDNVSLEDLSGQIIVADFFFTRCPSICPGMTKSMKRLQDLVLKQNPRKVRDSLLPVHFLSFSIDPNRDSVTALKQYADRNGVNHDLWWMLTGDQEAIYDFAIREMKLGIMDGNGVDTLFEHSPRFVLLDRDRVVRGYYNGLDSSAMFRLSQDIVFLTLEKDKRRPSALFQQLKSLWPIYLVVLLAVGILGWLVWRTPKTFKAK